MNEHTTDLESPVGEQSPAGTAGLGEDTLIGDVRELIDDGKTYLEAELQFQKSRAAFAADRGRSGAIFGVAALLFAHLALIALVVGVVLALTPLIGPWGATGVVVAVLFIGAAVFGLAAKRRFAALSTAFGETRK